MKVLFVTGSSRDCNSGFLWDGLRTVLGHNNVADGRKSAYLHGMHEDWSCPDSSAVAIVGHAASYGIREPFDREDDFDLMVATASALRDMTWDDLRRMFQRRVLSRFRGGKFVWYETLDSPREIFNPPFEVDAVFRREIDPAVQYPYANKPLPLLGATPRRWFDELWNEDKTIDVFNVQAATTCLPAWTARWESMAKVFQTGCRHISISSSGNIPHRMYLDLLSRSKLCVIAPGGGESSDQPRPWEAVAAGAIPVFVAQPCRPRPNWFVPHSRTDEDGTCFRAPAVEDLPREIDHALSCNLPAMRRRLKEFALQYHTAEARARWFLDLVERDAWKAGGSEVW